MPEMKFGIDVLVCDQCHAIRSKVLWKGGKCPNCGSESGTVRGKFWDQRIWLDGYLACGDRAVWADWAKDGFLVGEPSPELEGKTQR
jgi:hypothetical protein